MRSDEATLLDIQRACLLVMDFCKGLDKADLARDLKTQSAVLHELQVLGEAVKRLSPEFRANHPAIPWKVIAGMRDRLIHGYDRVDLEIVGAAAFQEVPALLRHLEPLVPKEE